VLPISLTIAMELPKTARQSMIDEVERIWRSEGIEIRWTDSPPSQLRLVIVQNHPRLTSQPYRYGLAEFDRSQLLVMASVAAAQRVVRDGLEATESRFTGRVQHALGLVLGRAAAHEIGHYLLGNDHARTGLMRAVFSARSLVDPRASEDFELDNRSMAQLAERIRQHQQTPALSTH
jgi:hypothetical protein